jgi:hypothetical protein
MSRRADKQKGRAEQNRAEQKGRAEQNRADQLIVGRRLEEQSRPTYIYSYRNRI